MERTRGMETKIKCPKCGKKRYGKAEKTEGNSNINEKLAKEIHD